MKYILIINSGSATLKFKLFELKSLKSAASGIVERIGLGGSFMESKIGHRELKINHAVRNHEEAFNLVLNQLSKISNLKSEISLVGHRVVHGGEEFIKPTVVTPAVLKKLSKYDKLSPLHNPANLMGIKACQKLLPRAKNVAVFDTGFYSTLPDFAYTYAIPVDFYKKYDVRRYGFHGISHEYVAGEAAKVLKKPLTKLNLITCHLGSGASITAIRAGKAVDTSMGFTPLEGLVMSTRSGDLDPAIPLYLIRELKIKPEEVDNILNKKSGLLGLSGFSDMREVLTAAGYSVAGFKSKKVSAEKKRLAKLALEVFVYRIKKYLGAYSAILEKVDAIIFTAGIGERNKTVRDLITKNLKIFGKSRILVIPTNEELMIARKIKVL
ncbi:acetate kinase [Patescibacteria group bacterium]|nr:acetate kinase [Patescibacteria group bacterium]